MIRRLLAPILLALIASTATAQSKRQAEREPPNCTATMGEMPKEWSGEAFPIDGDTLAGIGLKPRIRLWGIQAPELRDRGKGETAPGMQARAHLVGLLHRAGNRVSCRVLKWDRYCRVVAQCQVPSDLPDGTKGPLDIGWYMVATGYAYGFYLDDALPWAPRDGALYTTAEVRARDGSMGLWSQWLDRVVLEPMVAPGAKK